MFYAETESSNSPDEIVGGLTVSRLWKRQEKPSVEKRTPQELYFKLIRA